MPAPPLAVVTLSPLLALLAASPAPTEIPVPDSLVADGIPKLPPALAEEVGAYSEFRTASFASWHPDGKKPAMLISTRFGDVPQIHQVALPLGARKQLTFFPDRVAAASYPPVGDGSFFVFSKDAGGNEFAQSYRYDLATGQSTLLTDGKSRNSLGTWSNDGKTLCYTSTRRNGKDTDLYLISPADPKSDRKLADVSSGGWSPLDFSPDGRTIAVHESISINQSHLWLYDARTGDRKRLTPEPAAGAEPVAYGALRFAADGRSAFTTSDRGSEFRRLVRIDLGSGAETVIAPGIDWDVESFDLTRDGKLLAFVVNQEGASRLYLLDARPGAKPRPAGAVPSGVVGGVSFSPDGRALAFTLSSARTPGDAYVLDVKSGKVTRWTDSETGGLDASRFAEPEVVRWPTFDGKSISGFYYRPGAAFTGKRPVVVVIHGGPEAQSRPGFLGRNNFFLDKLGVALVFPNVRGSDGFGKSFLKLDNGFLREDSVKDIGALLDWLKTRPELDAERIMIYGGSYGGYMTLAVSTHYADRIRCAVDIVGISNFVSFLERTEAYRRDLRRVEYGDERDPKMRAHLLAISPLTNAAKIGKPLFVIQGKNDPRVPVGEAEQIVATVRKGKTPVWYLLGKDEGHGFAKKKNQDFMQWAVVAWMREYLLK